MSRIIDMVGLQVGLWTVLREAGLSEAEITAAIGEKAARG